jgi:hypothetical protein
MSKPLLDDGPPLTERVTLMMRPISLPICACSTQQRRGRTGVKRPPSSSAWMSRSIPSEPSAFTTRILPAPAG